MCACGEQQARPQGTGLSAAILETANYDPVVTVKWPQETHCSVNTEPFTCIRKNKCQNESTCDDVAKNEVITTVIMLEVVNRSLCPFSFESN